MSRRRSESVLSALGVSEADERRYQQVLPLSGSPLEGVAAALGVPVERLSDPLRGLLAQGMVSFEAGRLHVLPLSQVVSAAIGREAARGGPHARPARRPGPLDRVPGRGRQPARPR